MRSAATEEELVRLVASYLAELSQEQLARLPASSRPGAIARGEDVAALNLQVIREELSFSGEPDVAALLRHMGAVLTEASYKIAQLSRS
jgi:hypothetical protein